MIYDFSMCLQPNPPTLRRPWRRGDAPPSRGSGVFVRHWNSRKNAGANDVEKTTDRQQPAGFATHFTVLRLQ